MKIIVTGANGFIGGHMMNFLLGKGHEVIPLSRESGDLRDHRFLPAVFNGVDQVYHFAANMGGVGFLSKNNYQTFVDNMTMDLNVLRACKDVGVKRLFYPSSACAYPIDVQQNDQLTTALLENMLIPANADKMYGWEKLMMILLSRETSFVRVGILNTIFGEGQTWIGDKVKFPPAITYKVIQSKRTGNPISIWGNGNQTRTLLYIQDANEKIYEIMQSPEYFGEVNVASDETVTVKQCADYLCDIAGISPNYEFDLDSPSGVLARGIDNSKFNAHYKYRSQFSARQGFEKLYHWMEKQI